MMMNDKRDNVNGLQMLKSKLNYFSSFRTRVIWLVITIFSLGGMIDIPASSLLPVSTVAAFAIITLIAMFKATLFIGLLLFTRSLRWLSIVVKTTIVVYCLLCAINALGYCLFDIGITVKMMTVIGQTNYAEVREFIPGAVNGILSLLGNPNTYLLLLAVCVCVGILKIIPDRSYTISVAVCSLAGLIFFISVFIVLSAGRTNFSLPLRLFKSGIYAHREMCQIQAELAKVSPLPHRETVESSCRADIVMVIGESANRNNLSLYGYPLATTPELDSLNDRIIIFSDVIGSSTLTAYNMNRILTFLPDSEPADLWYKRPMLFPLMKEAGYHTVWLSNQEKSGIWGNATVAMVSTASDIRFVGGTSSDDATLQKYDDLLLPVLDDALGSEHNAKFIGIHLMGSHIEYRRRYPETFQKFTADSILKTEIGRKLTNSQAATLAEYNNSLLYTDALLARMIEKIASLSRPVLFIYFSDHGENVYGGGENFCGRDEKHVEVPFIIYPNPAYIEAYPQNVARLKEVSDTPMTTASICHLICSLTGTAYQAYDPTRDISSHDYQIRPRYVDDRVWKYEHVPLQ